MARQRDHSNDLLQPEAANHIWIAYWLLVASIVVVLILEGNYSDSERWVLISFSSFGLVSGVVACVLRYWTLKMFIWVGFFGLGLMAFVSFVAVPEPTSDQGSTRHHFLSIIGSLIAGLQLGNLLAWQFAYSLFGRCRSGEVT